MNNFKKNLYWYEGHLGALFFSDKPLSSEDLHCDSCGDNDWPINNFNSWENAYHGLVDNFSDKPDNYDTPEEFEEYYDPDYCLYDKKYICEKCSEAYGPITMEDFIKIEKLEDKKILVNVRLFDKSCREDDNEGIFAGYFVVENGKYKFNSDVDSEEWEDMWDVPIKWFESYSTGQGADKAKEQKLNKYYCICFDLTKEKA